MRKAISFVLIAMMLFSIFTSCASQPAPQTQLIEESSEAPKPTKTITISLYVQPYFAKTEDGKSFAKELVAAFEESNPGIHINIEELTADESGQKALDEAIKEGKVDLLFDSADAAVSQARMGKLYDLSTLFTDDIIKNLPKGVVEACTEDGKKYIYPIAVSPYLMAFNKEMLESAGVLDLLPYERSETRAWTPDEYTALLTALKSKLPEGVDTGVIYAKSSSGDAATRSLITNLFGASFVKSDRSEYTINSDEGKKAFEWLNKAVQDELLKVDAEKTSADVVKDFINGKSAHTILYTIGLANNYADSKKDNFTEILMPYPTQQGKDFSLEYSLYGLSVFDNGDSDKLAAAKAFIEFAAGDRQYSRMAAVMTGGISPNMSINELRYDPEYIYVESLRPYLGSYVPATEGYGMMKTYWFGSVADAASKDAKIETILKNFAENANQTLKDAKAEREEALKQEASSSEEAASK